MKFQLLGLLATTLGLLACSTPGPGHDQPLLLGRITARQPASSTASTTQSRLALSPAAMAVQETRHAGAHQVYTLTSADGVTWSVAATADFAIGACAQAWGAGRPLHAGMARLGELTLKPSNDCR